MKNLLTSLLAVLLISFNLKAQFANQEKPYTLNFGAGLFTPFLSEEGVVYENAEFAPETSSGFAYFTSFDYALSSTLAIGVG